MKTNNNNTRNENESRVINAINYGAVIPGLDWLFRWLDSHPRTSSALLWLMSAALAWAVWSYDFTIPAYK